MFLLIISLSQQRLIKKQNSLINAGIFYQCFDSTFIKNDCLSLFSKQFNNPVGLNIAANIAINKDNLWERFFTQDELILLEKLSLEKNIKTIDNIGIISIGKMKL